MEVQYYEYFNESIPSGLLADCNGLINARLFPTVVWRSLLQTAVSRSRDALAIWLVNQETTDFKTKFYMTDNPSYPT